MAGPEPNIWVPVPQI